MMNLSLTFKKVIIIEFKKHIVEKAKKGQAGLVPLTD